jgi:two-component system response regulator (stage 0 sporulation protein A)
MDKIGIEIVDDNEINIRLIQTILESREEFQVVGVATDGETAIRNIKAHEPDVVLLDIIMPGVDGLGVLEDIRRDAEVKKQPKILMVTAIGRDDITCEAFQKGADYYIMKPFVAQELIRHITMTLQPKPQKAQAGIAGTDMRRAELEKEESDLQVMLESDIMKIFASLGISAIAGGYRYLRDAVILAVTEPQVMNRVTKDLYPVIAEKYEATKDNVERQIRRAIEIGWGRADLQAISRYFGYTIDGQKGKPTNSEFIAQIADYLRLDYMKQGVLVQAASGNQ